MSKSPIQLNSYLLEDFIDIYKKLPQEIRDKVRKTYRIWKDNNFHPSIKFKLVLPKEHVWSVRIIGNNGYRALGIVKDNDCFWFWIGTHDDYMRELGKK